MSERNRLAEVFLCKLIEQADEDVDWSKGVTRKRAVDAAFELAEMFIARAELEASQ